MPDVTRVLSLSAVLAAPTLIGLVFFDSLLAGVGSRLTRLGLSFVAGAALLSVVVITAEGLLGVWLGYGTILVGVSVACAVVLIRRRFAAGAGPTSSDRWRRRLGALPVFMLLGLLAADSVTVPPRDWDGVMTWYPLARMIAHERTSRPSVLLDGQAWVQNPQYPPAIPLLNAILIPAFGGSLADERNLRVLSIAFLGGFLAIVHALASALGGRRAGHIAVALAATTQMVVTEPKGGALGGYADLPLASFLGLVLFVVAKGKPFWPLPIVIAAMAMTKVEGLHIAAGLALAVLVLGARNADRRGSLVAVLAVGVLIGGGLRAAWQKPIPVRNSQEYSISALTQTTRVAANLRRAAPLMVARMTPGPRWGALWLLTLAAALWSVRLRGINSVGSVMLAAIGIPLCIGVLAYAAHWDPDRLVASTWDRFLLQAAMPALAYTAVFLAWCLDEATSWRSPKGRDVSSTTPAIAEPEK